MLPPLRAGVAVGEALHFEGDYFGSVVNLAARLVAVAEPRQVVVPATLADSLGSEWQMTDLGARHLKGFSEPVALAAIELRNSPA